MTSLRNSDGWGQRVAGRCPACSWSSLFVAYGQHVTCATHDCPNPIAVSDALEGTHGDRPQYLVAVPPDVARLLTPEIVAALPALLWVAWTVRPHGLMPEANAAYRSIYPATWEAWEALGEALGADDA